MNEASKFELMPHTSDGCCCSCLECFSFAAAGATDLPERLLERTVGVWQLERLLLPERLLERTVGVWQLERLLERLLE